MTPYTLALFLHVTGAVGYFIGIGTWAYCAAAMRRASSVDQVRTLGDLVNRSGRLAVSAVLVLLAAGVYMAATVWGFATAWIDVSVGAVVVLGLAGTLVVDPRLRAVIALAKDAPDGAIPPALAARIQNPVLGASLRTLLAVLIGIVFLMTTKPSLGVSLLVIACALGLGLISGLPLWLAARPHVAAPSQRSCV